MKYSTVIAVVVAALGGCGKKSGDAAPGSGSGSTGSGSAVVEADWEKAQHAVEAADLARLNKPESYGPGAQLAFTPLPAPAVKPGPAYVWVKQVGLVTIDAGQAKVVVKAPDTNVFHMAIDPDGSPLVSSENGQRVRGGKLENVSADPVYMDKLALGPDGVVWTANGTKLARLEGNKWVRQPELDTGEGVISLDFDGAGRPILTSFSSVWVLDGGAWKSILDIRTWKAKDELGHPLWSQALVAPSGELWLLGCEYLVRIAGGKPTATAVPGHGVARGRFVDGKLIGIGCDDETIVRITPGNPPTIETAKAKTKAKVNILLDTHQVDARGRVWTASTLEGLAIINPDGTATTFPPGSLPPISGDVNALAVVGSGPDKLPGATEIATGTITGTVRDHGKPVAKAVIEMCRFPAGRFTSSPCELQQDRIKGETDDAGVFHIEGPLKTYEVVANINKQWYELFEKSCGGIAPGGECSIGVMDTANEIKTPASSGAPP